MFALAMLAKTLTISNAIIVSYAFAEEAIATEAIKRAAADGYKTLKSLIHLKFGTDSDVAQALTAFEADSRSEERRLVLTEELAKVNAAADSELVSCARTLLTKILDLRSKGQRAEQIGPFTGVYGAIQSAPSSSMPSQPASGGLTQLLCTLDNKPSASSSTNASIVRIFYATDRIQIPSFTEIHYDKRRSLFGHIHYGHCEISIPKKHRVGKMETPSLLRLEFRPNPDKHIILNKTTNLSLDAFLQRVREAVGKSPHKEALVFIHGYNVSFEDAARRMGQMAFDLNFIGAPIFYSWPSNGRLADYVKDETNITWSAPHFEAFLQLLSQHSGAERIHVIAHSMGNRAICEALKSIGRDANTSFKLNHLVLAAPDIDADTFTELANVLKRLSGRVTLYESSKDKAIQASKRIHGHARAGEPLLVLPGLDTIDATEIDTDFLGHSYFSDNWPLLSDIHSTIYGDNAPSKRFGLTEMEHATGRYYVFRG